MRVCWTDIAFPLHVFRYRMPHNHRVLCLRCEITQMDEMTGGAARRAPVSQRSVKGRKGRWKGREHVLIREVSWVLVDACGRGRDG